MVALPTFDSATVADVKDSLMPEDAHHVVKVAPFAAMCDAYVKAGYDVIPVMPGNKAPGEFKAGRWKLYEEWPSYAARQHATPGILHAWKGWPDANIGIILGSLVGGYQVVAVDVDTTDPDEQDLILSMIPPSRMRKQAQRGFTLFFRASTELRTKRYFVPAPTVDRPKNKRTVCELLTGNAPKQTVMPPSIHPCGLEYTGYGPRWLVPAAELPVLTDDHVEQLEDTLRHIGWDDTVVAESLNIEGKPRNTLDPDDGPNYWREINNAAMANFDAWVPELGLPKLKRLSDGCWEAVASWRDSNTGQATQDRKANLKFHPIGIKDMGTDEGFSPADVVMRAFSWPNDQAFSFLRSRLRMNDEFGFVDEITVSPPRMLSESEDGTIYDQVTGEVVKSAPTNLPEHHNDNDPNADTFEELPERLTYPEGLLGDVTQWIFDTARSPNRVLALGSAIVTLGTLAGRRDAGPTNSGTALYLLNLAPSGAGKQHGLDQAQRLMHAAGAEKLLGSGEFMSQTAAAALLCDRPLSLSPIDEFGSLLKRINSNRGGVHDQGISSVLRKAWGAPFGAYVTPSWANRRSQTVHSPAMSILGCSTPQEFYSSLTAGDSENGTLSRFLVLSTAQKARKVDPRLDAHEVPEHLAVSLELLYEARGRHSQPENAPIEPQRIPWGEGAKSIFYAFDDEVERIRDSDSDLADYYARTSENAVRLATICAVGRDLEQPEVSASDMEWGRDVSMWASKKLARDVSRFASDTEAGAKWAKVTQFLSRAPGGVMDHESLARKLKFGKQLGDILFSMQDAGIIERANVDRRDGKPGRPRRVIRLLKK